MVREEVQEVVKTTFSAGTCSKNCKVFLCSCYQILTIDDTRHRESSAGNHLNGVQESFHFQQSQDQYHQLVLTRHRHHEHHQQVCELQNLQGLSAKICCRGPRRELFLRCQIFNKSWLIELNTSSTKLCQFCKDILVCRNKAIYDSQLLHHLSKSDN